MNMVNGLLPFGSEMGVNTATKKATTSQDFDNMFTSAIENAQSTQTQFEESTQELLSGNVNNIHQVTVDANKAATALNLVVNLRDKAVEAYREVMQMSL